MSQTRRTSARGRNATETSASSASSANDTTTAMSGTEDDEEDVVEPTPPTPSRKRGRQSLTNSAMETTTRADTSANSSRSKRPRGGSGAADAAASQAQLMPPPSSQALTHTQSQSLSYELNQRSGKVSRIVLKNFMCHSNLAVDLNNRINLMIGHNGSGKSAILTALVIGMGSKASATSRSTNLTKLIKRGESSATIEIHLDNHAHDGFEMDKYGSKIIVQRSIFATGRSVYKIKNGAGTVVSSKRDDLLKMLMFLNIQVDNPVCVLNQDASRSFLRDSDPKKRYQLYMKASQIETIMEKLNACSVHVQKAKVHLRTLKEQALSHQNTVSQLGDRLVHLQSVDVLRQHIRSLRCQQSWRLVIVQEQLAAEIAGSLTEYQRQYDELRAASGNKQAMEQHIRDEMQQFVREREAMRAAMGDDRAALETQRKLVRDKVQLHEELQRKLRKLEQRRERQHRDVQQLERDLAEQEAKEAAEQADGVTRLQKERAANEARLAELRTTLAETEVMVANAQRDVEMLINTKSQAIDAQQEMQRQRQAVRHQTERLQRDIAQCQTAGQDGLLIYGAYMARLVAAIEAAHKRGQFTKLPLGPLGRYVQLEDARWKLPIENILGAHMQSFIVNEAADRRVLSDLIRKQFPEHSRYSIIATRFVDQVYDVRAGAVHAPTGTRRAMDVLRVSNPVVMNCLIDQCRVEMILLTEDESVAMRLTADEENVPTNLLRVMLLEPFSMFYPEPNYRSYSIEQRHARYLQVDVAERRGYLEAELRGLTQQTSEAEAAIAEQQGRVRTVEQQLAARSRQRQQMEESLRVHRMQIRELELIEYPAENEAEYFRNELTELQDALAESDAAIAAERERLDEHAALLAKREAELATLHGTVNDKEQACRAVQQQYDEAKHRLDNNAAAAQYSESRCRAMDADLQKLRKETQEADAKVQRLQATAERLGERIVSRYSDEELQRKLSVKERRVVAIESTDETLDMVQKRLALSREALAHTETLVCTLSDTLRMLADARKRRYSLLIQLKQNISLRVKHTFNNLLKLRNYSGDLQIDHEAHTLELRVVPRDNHIENAVSNAKSLSGGERSYSTIAFLLSLWSCVNFPFYFLDEYDVFTDQVNRHYITKLLLSEADKKPSRQYTFLTPQDMSNVSASDVLTIHRLAEPDR